MPRPKYGLGQGLDALVASRQRAHMSSAEPTAGHGGAPPLVTRWEYARLGLGRHKRKRLTLTISHPDTGVKPRTHRIRGADEWTVLGLLGAEGWELAGVCRRSYYFKRTVAG